MTENDSSLNDSSFLERLRLRLAEQGGDSAAHDKRHPARTSPEYQQIKWQAASEVDALCDRIIREIQNGLDDINNVVVPIAEPMAEQLATGAVLDIFEAAARVLQEQIRKGTDHRSS
jgi:hypothetical protein